MTNDFVGLHMILAVFKKKKYSLVLGNLKREIRQGLIIPSFLSCIWLYLISLLLAIKIDLEKAKDQEIAT